jgi:hypothetical protein
MKEPDSTETRTTSCVNPSAKVFSVCWETLMRLVASAAAMIMTNLIKRSSVQSVSISFTQIVLARVCRLKKVTCRTRSGLVRVVRSSTVFARNTQESMWLSSLSAPSADWQGVWCGLPLVFCQTSRRLLDATSLLNGRLLQPTASQFRTWQGRRRITSWSSLRPRSNSGRSSTTTNHSQLQQKTLLS